MPTPAVDFTHDIPRLRQFLTARLAGFQERHEVARYCFKTSEINRALYPDYDPATNTGQDPSPGKLLLEHAYNLGIVRPANQHNQWVDMRHLSQSTATHDWKTHFEQRRASR